MVRIQLVIRVFFGIVLLSLVISGCAVDAPEPANTLNRPTASSPEVWVSPMLSETAAPIQTVENVTKTIPTVTPTRSFSCGLLVGPDGTEIVDAPPPHPFVIGTLEAGTSWRVVKAFIDEDDMTWYQIRWERTLGYVALVDGNTLTGDCLVLSATPEPARSPTPIRLDDVDFAISVPGERWTVYTYTQTIPLGNEDHTHTLEIIFDLPLGQYRWVTYGLVCEGDDAIQLRWGSWFSYPTAHSLRCGQDFKEPVSGEDPVRYMVFESPGDAGSIRYSLWITLVEYRP